LLGRESSLLDAQSCAEDWVVHVLEVPHDSHIGTVVASQVKRMLGGLLWHTHLNYLVQQLSIQIWLPVFFNGCLCYHLLTREGLTLVTSETLQVNMFLKGYMEFNFKFLWYPVVEHESLKHNQKHLREGVNALTLHTDCALVAVTAVEVRDLLITEEPLKTSLDIYWGPLLNIRGHRCGYCQQLGLSGGVLNSTTVNALHPSLNLEVKYLPWIALVAISSFHSL
jgi:hypothetical protein